VPIVGSSIVQRLAGRFIGRYWARRWSISLAIRSVNRRSPIDIIEWPDFEGLFFRRLPPATDIIRTHGSYMLIRAHGGLPENRAVEEAERSQYKAVPNWIGVSRWVIDRLVSEEDLSPANMTVIHNPVDTTLFSPCRVEAKRPLVLYAGTISRAKGAISLAQAANRFLSRVPEAQLAFVGKDPTGCIDAARGAIDSSLLARVTFLHPMPRTDLAKLMAQAAVVAMPSYFEAFGNVWAEAMASGVPVVGSTAGSGPEVVPDRIAGLLVEPGDDAQIADAVTRLLLNPEMCREMGAAGRRIALQRYSCQRAVALTENFYYHCLPPSNRGPDGDRTLSSSRPLPGTAVPPGPAPSSSGPEGHLGHQEKVG
jgi:glycosyltransferase involved in cell wall biosynthesis